MSRPTGFLGPERVEQVVDGVHLARGFDPGNIIKVKTAEGPVIIDTASTRKTGAAARDALAKAAAGDATYVVYTHSHSDHSGGAESLVSDHTREIIAHELAHELATREHVELGRWTTRLRAHQQGFPFDDPFLDLGYLPPSLTVSTVTDLEVGGLTFHFEPTEGESADHLLVWIPELRLLCPGDQLFEALPNLGPPGVGARPIDRWVHSLERCLEFRADHLVPSHGPPVSGRDAVQDVLRVYRDAIQFIWDASVGAINDGIDVNEAARTITLPPPLASHPWLQPVYGTLNWNVRAVYDLVTGWYDLRAADLDPLPRSVVHAALVEAAGADAIVDRAASAYDAGDLQLALELVDIALTAPPLHPSWLDLKERICRALRDDAVSASSWGYYEAELAKLRGAR